MKGIIFYKSYLLLNQYSVHVGAVSGTSLVICPVDDDPHMLGLKSVARITHYSGKFM